MTNEQRWNDKIEHRAPSCSNTCSTDWLLFCRLSQAKGIKIIHCSILLAHWLIRWRWDGKWKCNHRRCVCFRRQWEETISTGLLLPYRGIGLFRAAFLNSRELLMWAATSAPGHRFDGVQPGFSLLAAGKSDNPRHVALLSSGWVELCPH